jgi:perosamine synthetase
MNRRYIHHSMPTLSEVEASALAGQCATHQLASGPVVEEFTAAFADFLGVSPDQVLMTGSGTQALYVALRLLEIRAGGRIAIPTYTCRAVVDAVMANNLTAQLADVDNMYCLTATHLDNVSAGLGNPHGIIAVHSFGHQMDLAPLRRFGCPIIEDCAHLLYRGMPLASDIAIFSFHATKLMTTGEGGAVVINNREYIESRNRFAAGRFAPGGLVGPLAARLSDLGARLGLVQLEQLPEFLERRRAIAAQYENLLCFDHSHPEWKPNQTPFRWLFRTAVAFDWLRRFMHERGVAVRKPVQPLLHHELQLEAADFPNSEILYASTVSLPIYPSLSGDEAQSIANLIIEAHETYTLRYAK